jgi:hypothetical protein
MTLSNLFYFDIFAFGFKDDTQMPQTRLPFFPDDIELINNYIGVQKKNGIVYYFNGAMPVYQHPENDYSSFRLFTSQLVVNGNAKQVEIVKAFNVSPISVKRWVKKYREEGSESFFYRRNNANPGY